MTVVVISPEYDHPREHAVLAELFAAGLERFHVRKPRASAAELEAYLRRIATQYRSRLILHQHHDLVDQLGLGGRHWRDVAPIDSAPMVGPDLRAGLQDVGLRSARPEVGPYHQPPDPVPNPFTSRSCHDLATLRGVLGHYDSVFFGPVFPSISKPGYGPTTSETGEALGAMLRLRTRDERRTAVIAIGGIDAATAPRALALGFDGVAVLGAVWQAENPAAAFRKLQSTVGANLFATPPRETVPVANRFAPTSTPVAL